MLRGAKMQAQTLNSLYENATKIINETYNVIKTVANVQSVYKNVTKITSSAKQPVHEHKYEKCPCTDTHDI